MRLLLSLILLITFSSEALADRGRLNRFGTLTVSTIEATGTLTLASESGAHTLAFNTDGHLTTQTAGGQLRWASGTASFPGYAFAADTNTGFAWLSADTFGASAGGTTVATFSSTGLDVTGEVSISGAATSTGVLCTKSDGDIGQCTSAVGAGGTCTCA